MIGSTNVYKGTAEVMPVLWEQLCCKKKKKKSGGGGDEERVQ